MSLVFTVYVFWGISLYLQAQLARPLREGIATQSPWRVGLGVAWSMEVESAQEDPFLGGM